MDRKNLIIMNNLRSLGFKKLLNGEILEDSIAFNVSNKYSEDIINKICNKLRKNCSKSLLKYDIKNSNNRKIIKEIITDFKSDEMQDLYGKIFLKRLEELGVDCKINLSNYLYKDKGDRITYKDDILYFITAIFSMHLLDKKNHLRTGNLSLIKSRITSLQYRMMLLFYYRISTIEVNSDILLSFTNKKLNVKYKSVRSDSVKLINNRKEKIPELADDLRNYYKNRLYDNIYRSEAEEIFIEIFNSCCIELGLKDKMILFKEQ